MAIFSRNASTQGTAFFQELCQNLENLSTNADRGRGDVPVNNKRNLRAAQNAVERTAWVMSTTEWRKDANPRALVWNANPSDITWSMPQRSVHSKNLFGTVMHVWPDNNRQTFFDEFRLTLNLQSGNLIPVLLTEFATESVTTPGLGVEGAQQRRNLGGTRSVFSGTFVPSGGIANFYDFMQLVDAPKLTNDNPPRINNVFIDYYSNLFPKLSLIGQFDSSGIRFTDSSSNPNMVTSWTVDFIVYDTNPRLTDNKSNAQSNSSLIEAWARERIDGAKIPR